MSEKVEHVIVLMLENRSFDQMLGYLDHPSSAFDPYRLAGLESNPHPAGPDVFDSDTAVYTLPADGDHSHVGVMAQLGIKLGQGQRFHKPYRPDNKGFVESYAQRAGNNGAERIMRCFRASRVPVLATLAKEFAVCVNWFCSVPGQTWPNRLFVHAGTSHGTADNKFKLYMDKTIFEKLSAAGNRWAIYHDGPAQAWAYPKLWNRPFRWRFKKMKRLYRAIEKDKLPHYAFVEPNHGLIFDRFFKRGNSQHPGGNIDDGRSFLAGEKLIADIYNALREAPEVFNKTLFVITYDEHGGIFDHVPPPTDVTPPDSHGPTQSGFDFSMLGPRVPAVLVSPWIRAQTVDETVYDHTSVIKTVSELFAPDGTPLSNRDRDARSFHHNVALPQPRTELPEVHPLPVSEGPEPLADLETLTPDAEPVRYEFDEFQESLIKLTAEVENTLRLEAMGAPAAIHELQWWGDASRAMMERFDDDRELLTYLEHVTNSFHRMVDEKGLELTTRDALTIDGPSTEEIEAAFLEVLGADEAEGKASLSDAYDRILTLFGSGRVEYVDLETGEELERDDLDEADILALVREMAEHNVESVCRRLSGPPASA